MAQLLWLSLIHIFLSAKSEVKDQMEGLQMGADDYIPKPFSLAILTTKIQNMLSLIHISIELAQMTPNCKYTLGSVLSHVTLHQTIIGLEAEKQDVYKRQEE